jgi:hypothetical protein
MPTEQINDHEIEYAGVPLELGAGWAAHLAICGPSSNPMHQNNVFPSQRVAVETVFASEADAEAEAHRIGLSMLASPSAKPGLPR